MPDPPPLPIGWRVEFARRTRLLDVGRVIVGSRSGRAIRLTDAGAAELSALLTTGVINRAGGLLARRLCDSGLAVPQPPCGDKVLDRLDVIVPVRDRSGQLDLCLAALSLGDRVMVVDDGSHDAAATAKTAAAHGARLIRRESSGGPAAARNLGLDSSGSELVAFIDSDVEITANALAALAAHLADPAMAAVAPRVRPRQAGRPRSEAIAQFLAVRSPLDLGADSGPVRPLSPIGYLPTACLVVRRDALSTPAFDEDLRHGEDVDLIWRLIDAGHRVHYDASIEVSHDEPTTWRAALDRRFRYGTSAGPLARRHGRRLAPLRLPAQLLPSTRRLRSLGLDRTSALSLIAGAEITAATQLSRTAAQLTWPLLLVLAATRPKSRVPIAVLLVVAPLEQWRRVRPALDPVRFIGASLIDDAAYGAGVWVGAIRARTARPLLPTSVTKVRASAG